METRVQYVLVGLFVIVLSAAGVGLSLWLAFGDITTDYRTYQIHMTESVSGLYRDAPVRYHGVEVGKVRALKLNPTDPERVIVTVDIESDIPIRIDTLATLKVQGLTGIASVELAGGKVSSPLLTAAPGQEYPVIDTGPSLFSRLDNTLSELADNLNRVARDLHALLDTDNREAFGTTLENLALLSESLAEQRQTLARGTRDAARFFEAAAEAGEALPPLLERLQAGSRSLEGMAEDFTATSQALRRQVETGGQGLGQVTDQLLPQFQQLMEELHGLSGDMRRLVGDLEQNPSRLLHGEPARPLGPGEARQ
ncbi:MAG: mammalian cell entry protein [Gammaproteobacteria bacterium]|nr:mammalian cell entry protein [Gammaproteobacteria bacterium]